MAKKIYIYILFLFFFVVSHAEADINDQNHLIGLTFKSHEVEKDERTSLNLIPDKPINLPEGFSLKFELKLQKSSFGHVFRIILNDSTSIDLFAFVQEGRISFVLNNPLRPGIVSDINISQSNLIDNWAKVSVEVGEKSIKCSIDKQIVSINRPIKDFEIDRIFFGGNKYKAFFTSDVPLMTIKHVCILNKDKKVIRYWDLGRHGNRIVYDRTGEQPALVENGVWEVDKHARWKKEAEMTIVQSFPQVATDSVSNRLFVATADSLLIFDLKNHSVAKIKTKRGKPFLESSSYLIFNYSTNQLISYNVNQSELITYDFKTNSWSGMPTNHDLSIQHHNRFIDTKNNQLVLFGGYGKFKYNSILATRKLDGSDWNFIDFSRKISPRYLATLGNCGGVKFLLFGGFGSKSGLQEQGPHNYYDLFELDVNTKNCIKLGSIKEPQKHYNFGNSMVISKDKFYTLAYRNDLQKSNIKLFEVNKNTLDYKIYDDSIPYCFLDRDSYCDLYLWKNKTLYTVILQRDINSDLYKIKVYSLAFPPLTMTDIYQPDDQKSNGIPVLLILGLCLLTLLFAGWFYLRKHKTKKNVPETEDLPLAIEETKLQPEEHATDRVVSTINLLGSFKVIDRNGKDISTAFTLITRQLFTVCVLELYTFGSGLKSKRLEELIWFDMDKFSATNNRNVNISKLRTILQQLEGISLVKENDFWEINITEGCSCDYVKIITLLNEAKRLKVTDKTKIMQIIKIAKAGPLLADFNFEWLDKYKSHYSFLLIDILMKGAMQKDVANDSKLLVDLSDVILIHDSIDEEAIQIKCRNLYKLGQKGLSKQCFDKFCADYKLILNEEPKLKYEFIISDSK